MSLPDRVTASAPGKLILMGEHAVVFGHPALAAAVDLRLVTRLSPHPEPGTVELRLARLGHRVASSWSEVLAYARAARERWRRFDAAPGRPGFAALRGDDPAHVAKVALGEAAAHLGEAAGRLEAVGGPGLRVEVESELPIGSGFGSSAALGVALVGGYLALRTGADPDRRTLERLAMEVERRQHGRPSGVDAAAVLHGGLVWAEGGAVSAEPAPTRSPHLSRFRAFDTGTPAQPTGEVVAAVRERVDASPGLGDALRAMGTATRRFRDLLRDPGTEAGALLEPIRAFEAGLETLGVVPAAARALIRAAEAAGGAGKISGAGALGPGTDGPGAGTLLLYHPGPRWPDAAVPPGLPEVRVALGGPGFRWEAT